MAAAKERGGFFCRYGRAIFRDGSNPEAGAKPVQRRDGGVNDDSLRPADERYMRIALELAKGAVGQTSPNPAVGCVLVRDGRIVGLGAHLKAGEPHAEVHALRMAGDAARGATAYVTLEPCSHHGRTPPCADALIAAGVRRVVVGTVDPNPLVAGRGIARLREAGIDVTVGVLEAACRRLNETFNKYIIHRVPFVTVKTASTLDGKIATRTGHSRWITSPAARRYVHELRRRSDAVLVGVGTVIADDPQLTVRLPEGGENPVRVVLDSRLRLPLTARVLTDGEAPTWVVTTARAPAERRRAIAERGAEVLVAGDGERVSIPALLSLLGARGIASLLVEGGGEVNASFFAARAVDKVVAFIAPKIVGGREAPTPVGGEGAAVMDEAVSLRDVEVTTIGPDVVITGYPVWEKAEKTQEGAAGRERHVHRDH